MRRFVLFPLLLLTVGCPRASVLGPRFDAPDAADAYYAAKRSGTTDPQRAYAIARAQMQRMRRLSAAAGSIGSTATLSWTYLGPGNIGGRTRTLVIDPSRTEVMYAGGVSGGVWKTTDAGAHWDAVGDELANLAVNSMAMDPRDHDVLYAGTGEGYFREEVRGTGLPLRGDGIFVTRDGGTTWQQLPSTATADFQWVNDLAISVHDSNRIYAATRSGVWRSTDGGNTWKNVLSTTVKGGCLELALRSDASGDYLFASCGTFEQATVYRATNAERDDAWTPVLSEPNMGRTTLAIAPSRPSTIYALAASNVDQALLAVFRSDENGDPGTWTATVRNDDPTLLNTLLLTNPITAASKTEAPVTMGWYCNTIAADPADPERVFAGGVDLFRSDDGGKTWGLASFWWAHTPSYAHCDQHKLVFDPRYDGAANQTLFLTNDGGICRTDNARARVASTISDPTASQVVFTRLVNDYGVTQFYSGAAFPDGRRFLGGAQDNSTLIGATGDPSWREVIGGDGGYVAVDPADPQYVYAEYQWANLYRSDDGGKTFKSPMKTALEDDFLFVTPFVLDANLPARLWIGGRAMWRTGDRGVTWSQASTTLDAQVSAIAVAPHDSEHVLAGTTGGSIYSTASGSTASAATQWNRVQPRAGWVSSIAFDPSNASTVYATYAGFGGPHVWRSLDGGTTWLAIDGTGTGTIPDIPVHAIAIDPTRADRLFLGTDLGVFASTDGGAHWSVENTGFAAVVTEAVFIGQGARGPAVYAFTHGRGAWRAELTPGDRRRSVGR